MALVKIHKKGGGSKGVSNKSKTVKIQGNKTRKNAASGVSKFKSSSYKGLSVLNDVTAILSGDPKKIATRILRKEAGKKTATGLGSLFGDFLKK